VGDGVTSPRQRRLDLAVDAAAVVGLSAVALLGLDDSFSNRAYLVTGMAAVLVVTAWALICTVERAPVGVFLLVLSVGFPVLGATAALHNYDLLGLPAPSSIVDLLTATLTAPGQFLTTIPPVDASGTVLAIPYALGFVLAAVAAGLALGTRRPLLPAVPLVLAMAACIVLGTEQPQSLHLRAGVFATTVLVWVTLRAARVRTVALASRGRTPRAVAATVVAVAGVALASSWVPSVPHQERDVLRGRVGSGQDVSELDNPLASFRKYTSQPPGTADNVVGKRLLRVSGLPRGDQLRFVTLDVYDGNQWVAGNRTVPGDNSALFQRIGEHVGAPLPGRRVSVGVEVLRPWTSSWLPLAGQLTGISFDYLDGDAQRDDVRYDVATDTGLVVGGLQYKDDFHFTALVPDDRLTRAAAPYGSGAPLQAAGQFLDASLKPWRTSGLTPVQQVFSLARYLRINGRFSNGAKRLERGYLPGQSPERLGPKFFTSRTIVGDDEQYAAFMALAANRLGVPARVVVGAAPDLRGWVQGRDVSAWVELRVADGSWRELPTSRYMTHKAPDGVRAVPPRTFVKQATRSRQSRAPTRQQSTQPAPLPLPVQDAGRHWTAIGLSLLVLLLLAVPAAKYLRRRRRRRAPLVTSRFVGGWAEVLDLVRDLGGDVPEGLPRTEQARRLGASLDLARTADTHVFARDVPTAEAATAFWQGVDAERRRLARDAGVVRRVVALWAPASLLLSLRTGARRWRRAARRGRPSGAAPPARGA
jgi:hypothetical protein